MKPKITENPTFNSKDLVAVGDVHGRFDLLWKLIAKLRDTGVHLLFLGDLIDRAQQKGGDLVVLNIVKSLMEDPAQYGLASVEALRGNHEQMFLDAAASDDCDWAGSVSLWAMNGGAVDYLDELRPHAAWVEKLPLFKRVDDTVFVHAGVRPNVALENQTRNDLTWIRQPFLSRGPVGVQGVNFVVHGHTPNFDEPGKIEMKKNRLNLDSGAYFSGKLTGFNHNTNQVFQVSA
jgi:serine/threonine protein phosphatase 1